MRIRLAEPCSTALLEKNAVGTQTLVTDGDAVSQCPRVWDSCRLHMLFRGVTELAG